MKLPLQSSSHTSQSQDPAPPNAATVTASVNSNDHNKSSESAKAWVQVQVRVQSLGMGKGKHRYLRPGALAQLRDSKALCKAYARNKFLLLSALHPLSLQQQQQQEQFSAFSASSSPDRVGSCIRSVDPVTPKMGSLNMELGFLHSEDESRLETLPMDLLNRHIAVRISRACEAQVRILCHLQHHQLKSLFHVSRRIRKAALAAKSFHFNYTTPERCTEEILNGGGSAGLRTPGAPRHGPRPPSRLSLVDMTGVAASLFQGSSTSSTVISRSSKKSKKRLPSHRVLNYEEEELCRAVAHNTIK